MEYCGERKFPVKGLPYTVKATDTDEYEFWYWEKDGKNVSEKKSYTFIVEEETLETMLIKPTQEEITAWGEAYNKDDYEEYWNHPMEVWARAFALEWTGFNQG